MTCPQCGAVTDGPYCGRCGSERADASAAVATAAPPGAVAGRRSGASTATAASEAPAAPPLLPCPSCSAPNAPSRRSCGRCHADLARGADGDGGGGAARGRGGGAGGDGPSRILVAATLLAVVAAVAVLVTLLSARGIGPLGGASGEALGEDEVATIAEVRSSSERRPSEDEAFSAEHVADGDETTAWVAEAGGEPWIELELAEPRHVTGLVLWNGHQGGDAFARHDRVAELRIEAAGRSFSVDLLDARGPLAVELPEPVRAGEIRLVVEEVFGGEDVAGPALSRALVRVEPEA